MSTKFAEYNTSHPELDKKVDSEQLEHSSNNGMPVLADGAPYVPGTEEEKRLLRKIDKHLLPMLWVMYVMNYIDRTNIGVSGALGRRAQRLMIRMPKLEEWPQTLISLRPITPWSSPSSSS
jgi:hypothetical protein